MMKHNVEVRLGKADYACTIMDGSHQYIADEPLSNGGADKGPNPYSYLLASLGSCTAITIKMYAKRKNWELEYVNITLNVFHKIEEQRRTTILVREIQIKGRVNDAQLDRLGQIARACPISKILEGPIQIQTFVKREQDLPNP